MNNYKRNSVKPATFDRLEVMHKLLDKYTISNMEIDNIEPIDIQRYINRLVSDGYAMSTIKKQLTIVVAPLRHANSIRLISHDPTVGIRLPSQTVLKKKKRNVEAYTSEEQARLVTVIQDYDDSGQAAVKMMLESGIRVGECLALDWSDIIWSRSAIRISKTCVRLPNKKKMYVQPDAKTYSSNRTIPLSGPAYEMLSGLFAKAEHPWIFSGIDGERLSYEALRYRMQKICAKAKVPYKGMHVLRHTFATNCYYRGSDVKILSKLLGHASTAITYSTYIDLFGDALEDMRSVVG